MTEPIILHIESSNLNCSVALSKGDDVLAIKEEHSDKYLHAEKLHLFLQEVIDLSGVAKSEINAIAVDSGPGSYTGLRIGFSSAKGLAFALGIPLIELSSLEIIAAQRHYHAPIDMVIPLVDARRMEVYCAVYQKR